MSLVTCGECGEPAELVGGLEIYPHRPDLAEFQFWRCAPCDAWTGCHRGTTKPKGTVAREAVRLARRRAHEAFDPIWMDGPVWGRKRRRRQAYRWLAKKLGVPERNAHIGALDVEGCDRVVEIARARTKKIPVKPSWIE